MIKLSYEKAAIAKKKQIYREEGAWKKEDKGEREGEKRAAAAAAK